MTIFMLEDGLLHYAPHAFTVLILALLILTVLQRACDVITRPGVHAAWKMTGSGLRHLLGQMEKLARSRHHDPHAPRSRAGRIIDAIVIAVMAVIFLASATVIAAQAILILMLAFLGENSSFPMMALGAGLFFAMLYCAKVIGVKGLDDLRDLTRPGGTPS